MPPDLLLAADSAGGAGVPFRELLLIGLAAAAVTYLLTSLVRMGAIKAGAVAVPRTRDVHVIPTPRLGGVGMFAGVLAAIMLAANLPALDITVDALSYQQQPLGHLQLAMQPRSNGWQLDQLWWSGPEGRARLTGMWQRDGREGVTALRGQFDSQDLGGLLARFGYPDTLRRGRLTAQGALQWQGGVLSPVLSSLRGDLSLRAENGQFAKINPGVGRLLGVISLQSLPRRLTLDFRDVFSDGFAFDFVRGDVIAVRNLRRDANEGVKKLVKDKLASEDDQKRAEADVQKFTDKHIAEIDTLVAAKEQEIMAV